MLTLLKSYLKEALIPVLYGGGILTMLLTIFKRVEWGLFLMVFVIPQPNLWYKFHKLPMGKDYLDFLFVSICLGLIVQGKGIIKSSTSFLLIAFVAMSYISLVHGSSNFGLPFPITVDNPLFFPWKNYAQMIFMYLLVLNVIKTEDQQKIIVVIMALAVLLIGVRSFRNFTESVSFSYDRRAIGPFGPAGLGSNHFGAFISDYCAALLGLYFFDKHKWRKWLYLGAVLFGLPALAFSYSRGAYLAFLAVLGVYGVTKKRALLIVLVVLLVTWQYVLPVTVVERIAMTRTEGGEIESSAASRLGLWDHALELFNANPLFGVGFECFGFTVDVGEHRDTHSLFLKTLATQGIVGMLFLVVIFFKAFSSGLRLYRRTENPFHAGLAFGFLGCVISFAVTNVFGDRWSYFVLGSYFWIFWALVDRTLINLDRDEALEAPSR
jgi:O-antigen ligase